ncbi:hypothetical protein HJC23_000503 [Cyclotella cryptica]|uniref:Putative zinc-finger domain-containing protein n=1 Tax=Cyclotella cryptica TaxID=29204 RepID=A0ABD3NQT3_9STRA
MSHKQDSPSTPEHQQLPRGHRSSFLPERFPPANPSHHYHDAFGDGDAGVDYGDPLDLEEGDYDSVDGSCGIGVEGEDFNVHRPDDGADGATMDGSCQSHPGIAAAEPWPLTTAAAAAMRTAPIATSLDELYEEVGLHETTLATLHSKLTELTSQIQAEERAAERLRQDIQKLTQQKMILKKRTEGGVELVKRVEGTLEKCLDRLRAALKRSDVAKNHHHDDDIGEGQNENSSGSFVGRNHASESLRHDENTHLDSSNVEETNTSQDAWHEHTVSQHTSNEAVNNKAHDDENASPVTENTIPRLIFTEIALHYEKRDAIQWPSTQSTDECQYRMKNGFPTWRTNLPSPSLWQNVDSIDLLTQLMNISSLENLLERHYLVQKSILPNDCGWVKESCIFGTPLDVYRHVDCKRWINGSCQTIPDEQVTSHSIDSDESAFDPNAILCPYELGGTCADDRCVYRHFARRPVPSVVTLSRSAKKFLRYYSLPDLRMPPSLSQSDFIIGEWPVVDGVISRGKFELFDKAEEHEQCNRDQRSSESQMQAPHDRVYPCPTCAKISLNADDLRNHLNQCNPCFFEVDGTPYSLHNTLLEESKIVHNETVHPEIRSENMSATHKTVTVNTRDITENHDFINLPTVHESSDEDESSNESSAQDEQEPPRKGFIFYGDFWWQELMPRPESECGTSCHKIVDMILRSFGFEAIREHDQGGDTETTHLSKLLSGHPYFDTSKSGELNETLLIARTIDFCRICIHMGQDTLGLAVLRGIYKSNVNGVNMCLLAYVEDSMKVLSTSSSACDVFTCQVRLLLISEFYRVFYAWQFEDNSSRTEPSLEELLNLLDDHAKSTNTSHVLMMHHLSSRMPSEAVSSNGVAQSSWEPFVSILQLQLEKHVVLPFSHKMTKKQQFSFLLECAHIGRTLQVLVESIHDQTFSPLSHALDPTWSVLQRLLQKSAALENLRGTNLLMSQVLLILVMGPLIFACVSNTISFPATRMSTAKEGERSLPQFDSRRRLDLSALDVFVVEMIKAFRRRERNTKSIVTVEPLLSTLYVLSVAISVSLGEFDKAQLRLENAFNSKKKSANREAPSMNVFSEMLWSQLVHLRMNFPSYHDSRELLGSEIAENPAKLLRPYIAEAHNEIASRIVKNGVILRGLDLCGDRIMISASGWNLTHRIQWQGVVSLAMAKYAVNESYKIPSECSNIIEFHISHEMDKPDGFVNIEFPRSLLITGQALTHLSIVGLMLDELPYSIGVYLTGLLVSEIIRYIILLATMTPKMSVMFCSRRAVCPSH